MLVGLFIRNIVLIDKLSLQFASGLWALTGETGAGKSILLDALGLAVGGRARRSLVRQGEEEGAVTVEFALPPQSLRRSEPVCSQRCESEPRGQSSSTNRAAWTEAASFGDCAVGTDSCSAETGPGLAAGSSRETAGGAVGWAVLGTSRESASWSRIFGEQISHSAAPDSAAARC